MRKTEIKNKVSKILRKNNIYDFEIKYGYDCFRVIIDKNEIFSDMIDELKNEFDNNIVLIRISEKRNFVIHFDAKSIIDDEDVDYQGEE